MTAIHFGALCKPLAEQLDVHPKHLRKHQRWADSITLLAVVGILSEGEARKVRKRLVKMIVSTLNDLPVEDLPA